MNHVRALQEELRVLEDRREPHTSKSTHSTFVYLTGRIKEINKQIEENKRMAFSEFDDEPIDAHDG
tara:strand:- start:169 stop:366 length:198 start_codon:yes stop_codon:yes gene_type:complete